MGYEDYSYDTILVLESRILTRKRPDWMVHSMNPLKFTPSELYSSMPTTNSLDIPLIVEDPIPNTLIESPRKMIYSPSRISNLCKKKSF